MKTVMTGCKPRQRSERPTLPEKNLTIQLDLFTAQKTDGTPRGEHREKVEQNLVQDCDRAKVTDDIERDER